VTTTTDIARRHGHTGPTNCQDCGTAEDVHFGSWFNPETKESGNFLQCCACGIKAGDPIYIHAECGAAEAARYVPNVAGDAYSQLAFKRIQARAIEALQRGQQHAAQLNLKGREMHERAIEDVLDAVGRAYAAAAINQVAHVLADKLDEETYLSLGDVAATLDLEVVEDLDGANGTGENTPEIRVFHRPGGWALPDYSDLADCTTNFHRAQDGRPACTEAAVWKVVEDHGLHLCIGFYCDADLPAEHRPAA
jgi:hypothetical protein